VSALPGTAQKSKGRGCEKPNNTADSKGQVLFLQGSPGEKRGAKSGGRVLKKIKKFPTEPLISRKTEAGRFLYEKEGGAGANVFYKGNQGKKGGGSRAFWGDGKKGGEEGVEYSQGVLSKQLHPKTVTPLYKDKKKEKA